MSTLHFFFIKVLNNRSFFKTHVKAFFHKRDQRIFTKRIPAVICINLKCILLLMVQIAWSSDKRGYDNFFKSYHRCIINPLLHLYHHTDLFSVNFAEMLVAFSSGMFFFNLKTRLHWNLMTKF